MMKVVQFTIQLKGDVNAENILWKADLSAPIPQGLEGGDYKGPLYLCVLDANKYSELIDTKSENFIIYRKPIEFTIDPNLYRPNNYVSWELNGNPSISSKRF